MKNHVIYPLLRNLADSFAPQDLSRAYEYLTNRTPEKFRNPKLGFVLGSAQQNCILPENGSRIPYSSILGFPPVPGKYSAPGHERDFLIGNFEGIETIVANGRNHYYEGYNGHEIAFLTRLMKLMGIEILVVTNAAGGLNPEYQVGDLMGIIDYDDSYLPRDGNPLTLPPSDIRIIPHLPQPYAGIYDLGLTKFFGDIAEEMGLSWKYGSYGYVIGPQFEPPLRTKELRESGWDAVGMSTIPEVIGMRGFLGCKESDDLQEVRIVGISGISNIMKEIEDERFDYITLTNDTSDTEVLEAINKIGPNFERLSREFIRRIYQ